MTLAKNSLFISYRKDDSGGWASKLAADLRAVFGNEAVFIDDSTGIPYGSQWPDRIEVALDQCRIALHVIAPDWHQKPNLCRLKNPDDWVRKELIRAHEREASILRIPVFVNNAGALNPKIFSDTPELQEAVQSLMQQQGLTLDRNPEHWPDKIDGLVSRVEDYIGVNVARDSGSNGENQPALTDDIRREVLVARSTSAFKRLMYQLNDNPFRPRSRLEYQQRKIELVLLKRVQNTWLKNTNFESLFGDIRVELEKDINNGAVAAKGGENIVQGSEHDNSFCPTHADISELFQSSNQSLLILGTPGSGKTYTLLELTQHLAQLAEKDSTRSIPVVLNLSTWKNDSKSLVDWLVEELFDKYSVSRKYGKSWVCDNETHPLIFLLDGLDEVSPKLQPNCVNSINRFRDEYGFTGIVVTSRIDSYENIGIKIKLDSSIIIKPLTLGLIDKFIVGSGSNLISLQKAINTDAHFHELARSPLTLVLMCATYNNATMEDLLGDDAASIGERTEILLKDYTKNMFERRSNAHQYSSQYTVEGLRWIAQQMKIHGHSLFQLSTIQPSWLGSRLQLWSYTLLSRFVSCVFLYLGVVIGFYAFSFYLSRSNHEDLGAVVSFANYMLFVSVFMGFIIAIWIGFVDALRLEWSKRWKYPKKGYWWGFQNVALVGLGFWVMQFEEWVLPFALYFGLRGRKQSIAKDIIIAEGLTFSIRRFVACVLILGSVVALSALSSKKMLEKNSVYLFNTEDWSIERTLESKTNHITDLTFSADSSKFAYIDKNEVLILNTQEPSRIISIISESRVLTEVRFSVDGSLLATTALGELELWDSEQRTKIENLIDSSAMKGRYIAVSPDGRYLAASGVNKNISIWDTLDWEMSIIDVPKNVRLIRFNPDSSILAWEDSSVLSNKIVLWSMEKLQVLNTIEMESLEPEIIKDFDFSPNGEMLAIARSDGVEVWSVVDFSLINKREISKASFSQFRNNTELVTGSANGKLELWNLTTNTTKILHDFTNYTGLSSGKLSNDGKLLAIDTYNYRIIALYMYSLIIFVVSIFFSLRNTVIETDTLILNQPILRAFRKSIYCGLGLGFVVAMLITIAAQFVFGPSVTERSIFSYLIQVVGITMVFAFPIAAWFGSLDYIQHFTLRIIIYFKGYGPWNFKRFLDFGVDRIFLRKVGGNYIFAHRMLLEYFAVGAIERFQIVDDSGIKNKTTSDSSHNYQQSLLSINPIKYSGQHGEFYVQRKWHGIVSMKYFSNANLASKFIEENPLACVEIAEIINVRTSSTTHNRTPTERIAMPLDTWVEKSINSAKLLHDSTPPK